VHRLLEDLEFVVELGKQGALAERPRDEAPLQLVGDVVTRRDLLLGVGGLRQQLGGGGDTRMHAEPVRKTSSRNEQMHRTERKAPKPCTG